MQAKTICSVLRRKIEAWADSVKDPAVREIIRTQTVVTGGAIASMLLKEPVNDYDVYFRTGSAAFAVAKYYVALMNEQRAAKNSGGIVIPLYIADAKTKIAIHHVDESQRFVILAKSAGVAEEENAGNYQYFEANDPEGVAAEEYLADVTQAAEQNSQKTKGEYRPVFMSSNAITLSDGIQIVVRFWGEPDQIHENYDFIHCTCSWTSWDGVLRTPEKALLALMSKRLEYVGSLYPICSVIRTRKFINRGWSISAGQYLKMAFQISDLNLRDITVLEDQLTGVDSAFFAQLIRVVRQDVENGKRLEDIDATYISQLVDRIF